MKKTLLKLFFIILLFFIIFFNTNYILATDNNSYSLSCTTADLFYIKSWGERECIAGNSTIFENLNNTKIELTSIPKIVLQSTDETETQWVYVEKRGNNYYFDIDLTRLTLNKEYIFKVKSNNTYGFQTLNVKDEIISIPSLNIYAIFNNNTITLSNTYSSPLSCSTSTLFYIKSWGERECIAGNSTIFENLNNTNIELSSIPKIALQSTDGTENQWVYVEKRGNNYYFDIDLTRLSLDKNYIFKVKSNNTNNKFGFQTLNIKDGFLAVSSLQKYITIKDNLITISTTYSTPLTCTTASLYFSHSWGNRDCIAGNSTIFESSNIALDTIPKIVLDSTDGSETQWVYVQKNGNNYYFDVDITRLSINKSYIFKIKSNSSNNKYNFQTLNIKDGFIAFSKYNKYITIKDNIINISNTYSANFGFEPAYLYFMENMGDIYLAGTAVLYEQYENGQTTLPPTLPKLELRSTDGSYIKSAYVEKVEKKYFFSVNLNDIDFSKTYYLQTINTNTKNLSTDNTKHVWIHSLNNNLYKIWLSSYSSYLTFTPKLVTGIYGQSGLKVIGDTRGSDLKYYKIGHGENVLFATFAIHGYEDLWAADGKELTIIAEDFTRKLALSNDSQILNKWTIYIFPQCNPDGANYGYTNNGPGRCTLTGVNGHGVDMNRCWPTSFEANYSSRNYTGVAPFGAYEAIYLRDFLLENKSKYGQTILIDLHGWTTQLIGDKGICLSYYGHQFYGSYSKSLSKYTPTYGPGYLINWAKNNLSNLNGLPARSALIELPSAGIVNHTSVVNSNYSQKYYNATINMLKGIL